MSKKKKDDYPEMTFTAYVIKGNRQVVRREVIASKRFKLDEDTYCIKPEAIFLKNVDGYFRSVSYYKEGNPNPYVFSNVENQGLTNKELDELFSGDFFHIISDITPDNKMRYVLYISAVNMSMAVLLATLGIMKVIF